MNSKGYIDNLFKDYEVTDSLIDFKEELQSNLQDRIESMKKKGISEKDAFNKAIDELGDISSIAEDISLKKKQEIFSEIYMKTRNYISPLRMALYVLCGSIIAFGVIVALISWYSTKDINAPLGTLLVFCEIGILGALFLGLTQETSTKEPMVWKRVLFYVITCGVFIFGIIIFMITYFIDGKELTNAIATLIPFVLPSISVFIFLVLTEKDRNKPWVTELIKKEYERQKEYFASPADEVRFGLYSGAIWIACTALFIFLTLIIGIKFSWLSIVLALVMQMLLLAYFYKGNRAK